MNYTTLLFNDINLIIQKGSTLQNNSTLYSGFTRLYNQVLRPNKPPTIMLYHKAKTKSEFETIYKIHGQQPLQNGGKRRIETIRATLYSSGVR